MPWLIGLIAGLAAAPTIIKGVVGLLVAGLLTLLNTLNTVFLFFIDRILAGQNFILENQVILGAWELMRNVANVLFFLALVAFAIMIITRTGGYNFKKAITGLVTAVVLANLSYSIVLVMIEVGDALKNSVSLFSTGVGNPLIGLGEDLYVLFWSDQGAFNFSGFFDKVFDWKDLLNYIGLALLLLIVGALTTYAFFRLAFILIERGVRLILLVIFAPIQFALSLLPHKDFQSMAQNWWSDLIRWVLVLPLAYLLLGIALRLKPGSTQGTSVFDQAALVAQGEAGADFGVLMYYIVVIALMLSAANAHTMLKVPISAATKFFTDTLPKMGATLAKGAIGAMGKDLAFKTAMKFPVIKAAYGKIAGVIGRGQTIREQQAGQRKLFAQGETGKQLRRDFLGLQAKVELELKQKASQFGLNWDTATDEQRGKIKDMVRKGLTWRGGDRSYRFEDLATLEIAYMSYLGKASQTSYELGRTPEETKNLYEEALKKFRDSGEKDPDAASEAHIFFNVLKMQALRLAGEPGKEAARYRNEIADRDGQYLLDKAGLPKKFGISKVGKEGDEIPKITPRETAKLYASLAEEQQKQDQLANALRAQTAVLEEINNKLGGIANDLTNQVGERDLAGIDPHDIDKLLHRTPDQRQDDSALKRSADELAALTPDQQANIKSIQGNTALSPDAKTDQINGVIRDSEAKINDPGTRDKLANLLADTGIDPAKLGDSIGVAQVAGQHPDQNDTIKRLLNAHTSHSRLEQESATVQDRINTLTADIAGGSQPEAAYTENVNQYFGRVSPDVQQNVRTDIRFNLDQIKQVPGASKKLDTPVGQVLPEGVAQRGADLVNQLQLQAYKLGKNIDTAEGYATNMTLSDHIDLMNKLNSSLPR